MNPAASSEAGGVSPPRGGGGTFSSPPLAGGGGGGAGGGGEEAGDDAGQGALHARDDDEHVRGEELGQVVEEAVDAGDTDVADHGRLAAEQAGGERRLLGDGQVGGAGANDADAGQQGLRRPVDNRDAGEGVVLGVGHDALQGAKAGAVEAGDEETAALGDEALADRGDLLRRLALTEYDLGQVVAQAAV